MVIVAYFKPSQCVFSFQTERAYQKQPTIFQNKKRVLVADGGKEAKEKIPRYHKSVGLGFKTPREVTSLLPRRMVY
uniref:Small ribosomal subunit protein uS17 N-terminal domain-containing protein n=1 Tax=Fundulus heteroclitus TaxID=8078 RepID=A0A3Q2NYZ8_FUNHE